MVLTSDSSVDEIKRLNQELKERQYEFRSNCNDGDGDATACHSWGEWLAVVDKNYTGAAKIYELNCSKKGYPASCFNLGRLKRTAADLQHGYVSFGLILFAGKGVDQNDLEAFKLFGELTMGET
ncbi:hypothetical protein KXD40_000169 [Peronospora effusa]|uniref:Uncharacterized protein n=1 Tax=Peronospora effusa TaxID=542832 RepID=A0A3R7W6W7_9STRA|nr:hypothetical protein DD237_001831 [Peronospora effusa]UIZ20746.1 hypothetical protein KXD40_000169 [Peronospora effusa]